MNKAEHESGRRRCVGVNEQLAEAAHLQAIEGNPLSPDELAMFEREGWPPEERRACIARKFKDRGRVVAAE